MKILLKNNKELFINNNLLKNNFEKRNSKTSYLNEFKIKNGKVKLNTDFLYRLVCYNNLYNKIKGTYKTNLDIFGGVGITAKLFSTGIDNTFVNDISEDCLSILKMNFLHNNITNIDVSKEKINHNFDLVLCDFNDFTIKKFLKDGYKKILDNVFDISNKYVIINDCSFYRLKYGKNAFSSYSLLLTGNSESINNIEDFFIKEKIFFKTIYKDWELINIEYFNNSSFLLFKKKSKNNLKINKVIPPIKKIIECEL